LPEGIININAQDQCAGTVLTVAGLARHNWWTWAPTQSRNRPGATFVSDAKSETASVTISADLWRQLKPGSLLAAAFDEQDNLAGWWKATVVRP
jgi:hypothetical protein